MVEATYLAVVLIGLVHGLEPGHGWPVAMLYALRRRSSPLLRGFIASFILSAFHLISSVAVVVTYVLLSSYLALTIPYVNYVAGGLLLFLALRFWNEKPKNELEDQHGHIHDDFEEGEHTHEHEHPEIRKHTHTHKHLRKVILTLKGLTVFAFVLGFAHEEEFALLSLAVGGVNPLFLMLAYASAVTVGIVGITLIAVKAFHKLEAKFKRYEYLLPKISAVILAALAMSFLLGLR